MKLPRHPSSPPRRRSHPICCTSVSRGRVRASLLSSPLFSSGDILQRSSCDLLPPQEERGDHSSSERVTRQHRRDGLPPPLKAHNHGQRTTDRFVAVGWLDAKIGQLADQRGKRGRESPLISTPLPSDKMLSVDPGQRSEEGDEHCKPDPVIFCLPWFGRYINDISLT